eukprot:g5142.t1
MLRSKLHVIAAKAKLNRIVLKWSFLLSNQTHHGLRRGFTNPFINGFRFQKPRLLKWSLNVLTRDLTLEAFNGKLWDLLDEIQDPNTRKLAQQLDPSFELGIDPKNRKVSYLRFFHNTKVLHRDKLILVRIGDCYVAVGIDAVMIVNFTSQPQAGEGIPMTKCSQQNLPHLLHTLTRKHGFTVVVCEESSRAFKYGERKARRAHYTAAIVGGVHQSSYFGNDDFNTSFTLEQAPIDALSAAAVSSSQTGYTLLQYFIEKKELKVISRMTEEALWSKLKASSITAPIYIHKSTVSGADVDSTMNKWRLKAQEIAKGVFGSIKSYDASDPVHGFLQILQENNPSIKANQVVLTSEDVRDRTSPPPLSTVNEIGVSVKEGSGVLPLLEYLLPRGSAVIVSSWIRECVLDPPPPHIAKNIQVVLRALRSTEASLPDFRAHLTPARLVQIFKSKKLTLEFLDELRGLLEQMVEFLMEPEVQNWIQSLLHIVQHETKIHIKLTDLLENCQVAISEITKIVLHPDARVPHEHPEDTVTGLKQVFESIRDHSFRAMNPAVIQKELKELDSAERVLNRVGREFQLEVERLEIFKSFSYEPMTNTVHVIISNRTNEQPLPLHFLTPDKQRRNRITTTEFGNAQSLYFGAYEGWRVKVTRLFEKLGEKLEKRMQYLITTLHALIILSALTEHTIAAQERQWCLPDISTMLQKQSGSLEINGFWPYWMTKEESQLNSIQLDGMIVLTGPNMAGKSTVLRSVATVCSLAVCGFYIPAENARIPFLDCVNFKTLVTDSPMENRSAFGMEMMEMHHVLNDATKRSLILIDELGKGTEVIGGTALSASMLTELSNRGCIGIFATHLHLIKEFEDDYQGVKYYQMEVTKNEDNKRISTWKMIPGFSEESLGLDVALEQGIPLEIVNRSEELLLSIEAEDDREPMCTDVTQVDNIE